MSVKQPCSHTCLFFWWFGVEITQGSDCHNFLCLSGWVQLIDLMRFSRRQKVVLMPLNQKRHSKGVKIFSMFSTHSLTRWWQLKYFWKISPRKLGKWSNLTCAYFSNGLVQPPTSWAFFSLTFTFWWQNVIKCKATGYILLLNQLELGGGFKYFLFSPLPGEMIQFDEHIFQMGWFNHQLVNLESTSWSSWSFT